ncbi:MAG: NAD-dependent epimerase/dehydratase family protein [Pyrinomonadaceae bacterium]
MKEISIIGATSHLGVKLIDHLADAGFGANAAFRSADRVPVTWLHNGSVNCVPLELSEPHDLGPLCVPHVVWLAHLGQGRFNERETAANLEPFERFLRCAERSRVKQITFISSGGAVYGEARTLPIVEDHPRDPLSSYGKTKKAMEDALIAFGRSTGIRTAVIRPGNIYGFESPEKASKGIIGAFLDSISRRKPFTLLGGGSTVRDFIHVDDVCRAIVCALRDDQKEKIWNVGTEIASRISDVLDLIIRQSGLERPEFVHEANYASDVGSNVLSIDRITGESVWMPGIDIETGIDTVVKNWTEKMSVGTPA